MLTYMDIGMVGHSMRCAVSKIAHQRGHNEKDQSYQEARDKQERKGICRDHSYVPSSDCGNTCVQ
jgi:hypothetical protein